MKDHLTTGTQSVIMNESTQQCYRVQILSRCAPDSACCVDNNTVFESGAFLLGVAMFTCEICGESFRGQKMRANRFCSRECYSVARTNGKSKRHKCLVCGIMFESTRYRPQRYCSLKCAGVVQRGNRYGTPEGYKRVRQCIGSGCNSKLRHRLIMEQVLGRLLNSEEVVHHINGDDSDNRPVNLMVFPNTGSHSRYHAEKRRLLAQGTKR
jgi:hypothetical protein